MNIQYISTPNTSMQICKASWI